MLKTTIDFGLVVLIWMTQVVVYPSFLYFESHKLKKWHEKYTEAITLIVLPLMLGQLSLHLYSLLEQLNWFHLISFAMLLLIWVNTFFLAVPLHNKIAKEETVFPVVKKLIRINWFRTILWTIIFIMGLLERQQTQTSLY